MVANYLGAAGGAYGYGEAGVRVQEIEAMTAYGQRTSVLPQFSAQYIDLQLSGDVVVKFQGDALTTQVPTQCRSGRRCWWGNRGDSIDSVLTKEFDFSGLTEATLEFWTWFSLEDGWDFAYVEVSTNDGETWTILPGQNTTSENPVGNSYGHGFTGRSGGWIQERIDLSPYVGQKVLLRFEHITGDSVYLDGFVIDDIAVPQLQYLDDAEEDTGWEASGFVRTDNELPQHYLIQVVEQLAEGGEVVREIGLNDNRNGETLVQGLGSRLDRAVIIISPVTVGTNQPARYTLDVSAHSNGD